MIITVEIEAFTKELEEKLPGMDEKRFKYWKDKVHLLNRINLEFMEYEDLMRNVALQNAQANIDALKFQKELQDLRKEVEHLKSNING